MTSRPDRRHALTLAATVGLSPAVLAAVRGTTTPRPTPPDDVLDTGHTPDAPDPGPLTSTAEITRRRRQDLPGPAGRGDPAHRGRVQVLHRGLHPPGLHRQLGAGGRHPVRVPRQRLLDRGRVGGQSAGHRALWTRSRSPSRETRSRSPDVRAQTPRWPADLDQRHPAPAPGPSPGGRRRRRPPRVRALADQSETRLPVKAAAGSARATSSVYTARLLRAPPLTCAGSGPCVDERRRPRRTTSPPVDRVERHTVGDRARPAPGSSSRPRAPTHEARGLGRLAAGPARHRSRPHVASAVRPRRRPAVQRGRARADTACSTPSVIGDAAQHPPGPSSFQDAVPESRRQNRSGQTPGQRREISMVTAGAGFAPAAPAAARRRRAGAETRPARPWRR